MKPKPLILGLNGASVTEADKSCFSKINPLGIILFKKNLINKEQTQNLCNDIRSMLERKDVLILVDQEGGSIYRLTSPSWRIPPAPLALAKFAYSQIDNALNRTMELVELNAKLIAFEMKEVGINANCAPVADLLIPDAHHITGTRSFGPNPDIVSQLVSCMAAGLKAGGVQAIIKHMPGQGRVRKDSHLDLPVITESLETLENTDFKVFQNVKDIKYGMLAHLKYTALDSEHVITYSKTTINYIKTHLGFDGILVSDCISMKALSESWRERATKSIAAGIDLVLFGGSNHEILCEIAQDVKVLSDEHFKKIQQSIDSLESKPVINFKDTLIEYNKLLESMEAEFMKLSHVTFSTDLKLIIKILDARNKPNADYSSPVYAA